MRVPVCLSLLAIVAGTSFAAQAQWTWTPQTGRWVNLKRLPKETPELQVEHARSLLLAGKPREALRETDKFVKFYANTDFADDNQYLRGEIRMAQDNLRGAAKEFQQVVVNHPDTDLYDDAIAQQYAIGDRFYDRGQKKMAKRWALMKERPLKHAITTYGMVIENQPFTPEAAQAQYKVGLCHFARKEYIESAFEYRRVIEEYAGSDWVDEAAYGLAECYYESSLPPDYDQTPSHLAIAAIDDFNARFPGDTRGSGLGERRQEMRNRIAAQRLKSAQFYEKRRQFRSAKVYYEVVAEQYSDTDAAQKAAEWLKAHEAVPGASRKPARELPEAS